MDLSIERAAVIGSGVMGSALAAHFANAGIRVLLLDIVPPSSDGATDISGNTDRNALARSGLQHALKAKPAAFYHKDSARLIEVGNLEDDLAKLADCDWVLEAIVERMDIKKDLYNRIAPHLKPEAIVTSNTSGLSITEMASALTDAMRPRFLGTHFFNPPRYLRLLELIPHAGTDPAVLDAMRAIGTDLLGKGVVVAKDTPNFIGNRIGVFTVMSALRAMIDGDYTVEEADALTGPTVGRPKSATFRTADLVGIDVLGHASNTVYERATDDPMRDYFKLPDFVERMIKDGMLGQKAGKGFYKKVKRESGSQILALDWKKFDYREQIKPKFTSVEMARNLGGLGERVGALLKARDRAGDFVRKTVFETLAYSASLVGEISDDIVAIDDAMRWGFGWKMGPFELWDAVGVEATAKIMQDSGIALPPLAEQVLASPQKKFYASDDSGAKTFFIAGDYKKIPVPAGTIDLKAIKAAGGEIKKNAGASLIDIGDGVACLEFHSKMNAIGADIIGMVHHAVKEVEANFEALVVGNQGSNFSVGANIMLLLLEAQEGNWEEIDLMVRQFQKGALGLRYCKKPVVAAPFGMTLAGGCEIVLGAGHAYASAETYMGLVEVGVGLIPAGGGCKEMLFRNVEGLPNVEGVDPFLAARAAFETIGLAKVSMSAAEARDLKSLRASDGITMNPDRVIPGAKQMALGLARAGYKRPDRTHQVPVAGEGGIAAIRTQLYNMKEGGYISEYDAYLGGELARIVCGGELPAGTMVGEQYLLDLEREVFLRLCGQRKTQERIQHMLKKGKPLRN